METNKNNSAKITSVERMYDAQKYAEETYELQWMDEVSANPKGSDYQRSYSVLTGFDSFEQAQDVARKFRLDIRLLSRRDGQHTWTDKREAWEALKPMEIYGDDYLFERFRKGTDTVADIVKELHGAIEGMDDDETVDFVKRYNEIIENFVTLKDGEWIAVNESENIMTFEDEAMECNDGDTTRYIIGVTDYGIERPEPEDEE
jgi:hypothetical protein